MGIQCLEESGINQESKEHPAAPSLFLSTWKNSPQFLVWGQEGWWWVTVDCVAGVRSKVKARVRKVEIRLHSQIQGEKQRCVCVMVLCMLVFILVK